MTLRMIVLATVAAVGLCACDGGSSITMNGAGGSGSGNGTPGSGNGGGNGTGNGTSGGGSNTGTTIQQPLYCNNSQPYTGVDGRILIEERLDITANTDRMRVKPYTLLSEDMARALGTTPAFIQNQGSTFNTPQVRWNIEPALSGVNLYQAFKAAFQGCRASLTQAPFQSNPTQASATTECRNFQLKFWSREPTAEEVATCASFAVSAQNNDATPRNRWAYACASVLASVNFLAQ